MKTEIKTAIACIIIITVSIIAISTYYNNIDPVSNTTSNVEVYDKSQLNKAPNLFDGTEYINMKRMN